MWPVKIGNSRTRAAAWRGTIELGDGPEFEVADGKGTGPAQTRGAPFALLRASGCIWVEEPYFSTP